jgi:hypothetical protein
MRTQSAVSLVAAAFLALGIGGAVAQHNASTAGFEASSATKGGTPPRESTSGETHRSPTAAKKGANKTGFCPPGQKRKAGKGSAFQC